MDRYTGLSAGQAQGAYMDKAFPSAVKEPSGIDRLGENIARLRAAVREVDVLSEAFCGSANGAAGTGQQTAKLPNGFFDRVDEHASDVGELADELCQHVKRIRSRM